MRQGFSFENVHAEKYLISRLAAKPKLVGTARGACPMVGAVALRRPRPVSVSEGGTNVVGLASRGSCPAEDGEAPDRGLRSALSLPCYQRKKLR